MFLWLCDNIPQFIVVFYYIVCDVAIRDRCEVATCTFYLHTFCSTIIFQAIFGVAFCFCHEVDVLDAAALMEYHGPVWIIVTDRRIDREAIGKFRIDSNLITRFQLISEVHLNAF